MSLNIILHRTTSLSTWTGWPHCTTWNSTCRTSHCLVSFRNTEAPGLECSSRLYWLWLVSTNPWACKASSFFVSCLVMRLIDHRCKCRPRAGTTMMECVGSQHLLLQLTYSLLVLWEPHPWGSSPILQCRAGESPCWGYSLLRKATSGCMATWCPIVDAQPLPGSRDVPEALFWMLYTSLL